VIAWLLILYMRYCTIEFDLLRLVVRDWKINRHRFFVVCFLVVFVLAMQVAGATENDYPVLPDAASESAVLLVAEGETDAASFDEQAREMRIWLHQRDQERRSGSTGTGQLDLSLPDEFVRSEANTAIHRPLDPFRDTAIDDSGYRTWGNAHVKLRRPDNLWDRTAHRSRHGSTVRHGKSAKSGKASAAAKKNADKMSRSQSPQPPQAPAADNKKGRAKKSREPTGVQKEKPGTAVQATDKKQNNKPRKTSSTKSR
jgi:hypothetical protein